MTSLLQNLTQVDFKMLRTLLVLIDTGNLSRTADILGIQQSTVSYHLARLRETLNDPLLIRVGRSFEPSPFATQVSAPLAESLLSLEKLLFEVGFDGAVATGKITIASPRMGVRYFIDDLICQFSHHLPNVTLEVVDWTEQTTLQLQEGRINFSVGFEIELPEQILSKQLGRVSYCAVMSEDHPLIKAGLTDSNIFDYAHVKLNNQQTVERWIDYLANKHDKTRRVIFESSSLEFALSALNNTDRILFIAPFEKQMLKENKLTSLPLSFVPPQAVHLLYHQRTLFDPLARRAMSLIEGSCDKVMQHLNMATDKRM